MMLLVALAMSGTAAAPLDPAAQLAQADRIKTVSFTRFAELVDGLHRDEARLDPAERWHLRFLDAWRAAYVGDYATATRLAREVIDKSGDATLRFRAGATLVNMLDLSHHYEDAFEQLGALMEQWPNVTDPFARYQVASEASQLYTSAGEYDLALQAAGQMAEQLRDPGSTCKAETFGAEALYLAGRLSEFDERSPRTLALCLHAGEILFANGLRVDMAALAIDRRQYNRAVALLQPHLDELRRQHYPHLVSRSEALLARAYLGRGELGKAEREAHMALSMGVPNAWSEPLVQAYGVLYEAARQRGDFRAALHWHEQYARADKGHLDDAKARALAYQMVRQRVLARRREVDELSRRLQIVRLQQALDHKDMETVQLYVVLLLVLVVAIGFWVFHLKRSQLRFRNLAHKDGLTGVFNRAYFMDLAHKALARTRKASGQASLLLIDLDHFKAVNDTYGHAIGDLVLRRVAAICQCQLHGKDILGRLGGEEFAVLLPGRGLGEALARAEELRRAIAVVPEEGDEICIVTSASIGVSSTEHNGHDLGRLLCDADGALYRAKRTGRNRVMGPAAAQAAMA